jgi:hypothetical protein
VHDAIQKLHQLAHAAISGETAWPATPDESNSVWKMLAESGLTEELPDGTIRYTDPSTSAEIELSVAFIGAICPWDVPFVLQEHGYASEAEALEVWEAETELEALRGLKLLIFRAFQMHAGKPTACSNSANLIHLLGQSVAIEQDAKRAKRPKKPSAQTEMLLPIDGKKSARKR